MVRRRRILFVTFAPLAASSGHTARLALALPELSRRFDVEVLCMRKGRDGAATRQRYPRVHFSSHPVSFSGWSVTDAAAAAAFIAAKARRASVDLVGLAMEVWDIARELSAHRGVRLALLCHGVPFVGAPLLPLGTFEEDVKRRLADPHIEPSSRSYIARHAAEARDVLRRLTVIANNETCAQSLASYFPEITMHKLSRALVVGELPRQRKGKPDLRYDFAYVARAEAGKGAGDLPEIAEALAVLLNRPVKFAVAGRADDAASKRQFARLARGGASWSADVTGWLEPEEKARLLLASAVFAYPSRYDNYPTVLNEAIALGVPAVTWDVPLYRCCYSDVSSVAAVPLGDTGRFAEAIAAAAKQRHKRSDSALRFARRFGARRSIGQYDAAFFANLLTANA